MPEIEIFATRQTLSINDKVWKCAPELDDVLVALGSARLTDGDFVTINRNPVSQFRYFDEIGISILEAIPEKKVARISVNLQVPHKGPDADSMPIQPGERATKAHFSGTLHFNGCQLQSPLLLNQLPTTGDLVFVNRMAFGDNINVMFGVDSRYVDLVMFEFTR